MATLKSFAEATGQVMEPVEAKTPTAGKVRSFQDAVGGTYVKPEPGFFDQLKAKMPDFSPSVSMAEMIAGGPGMVVGAVAGGVKQTLDQLGGMPRQQAEQAGNETAGRIGAALNPVTVLKNVLGYQPAPNQVDSLMGEFGKWIKRQGEAVESQYQVGGKPVLTTENVESFANFAMGLLGTKPIAKPLAAKIKTLGEMPKEQLKPGDYQPGGVPTEVTPTDLSAPRLERAKPATPEVMDVEARVVQERPALQGPKPAEAPKAAEPVTPEVTDVVEKVKQGYTVGEDGVLRDTKGAEVTKLDPKTVAAVAALGVTGYAMKDSEEGKGALMGAAMLGMMKLDKGVTEPKLVEMIRTGTPEEVNAAAAKIYADNVPKLERAMRKYQDAGVDAATVAHDVVANFITEVLPKGGFKGEAQISTYLFRMAQNEAMQGYRQVKRAKTESLDLTETPGQAKGDAAMPSAHEQIADTSVMARAPDEQLINGELGKRLQSGLDKLPEQFRAAFEMAELEGLPYADIAERTGQPIGTVRSQIARARAALQEHLKEWADPKQVAGLAAAGGALAVEAYIDPNAKEHMAELALGAAAIKGKGGMWHPETVAKLSHNLVSALSKKSSLAELPAQQAWATGAVTKYLNRYAGTAADPLRDVKMFDGQRWEDVTDKAFRVAKASEYASQRGLEKVPAEEGVWGLKKSEEAANSITTYMRHVSDYLAQNVDPAKLPQYDLVRAVQETVKRDVEVAKRMEKAAQASLKELPVYKGYADGMRWVEIKAPESLTAEQAKTVRSATRSELMNSEIGQKANINKELSGYVALDAQGKVIINSFTERAVAADTPIHAWLAGRLAEEGNTMGHCVGGYWQDVVSGGTRILSLRDSRGGSHVTVELVTDGKGTSIEQIKGKQNAAPVEKYLPYVQDFVKGEKWGKVGDLENSGLVLDKYYGDYVTPEEIKARNQRDIASGRMNPQSGKVSVDQLTKLGMLAGGVIAGANLADDKLRGAMYGAGVAALLSGAHPVQWAKAAKVALDTKGPRINISGLIKDVVYSNKVGKRAVMQMATRVEQAVPDLARRQAIYDWLEGERATTLSAKEMEIAKEVRAFYDTLGQAAKSAGVIKEMLDGYATRIYGKEGRGFFDPKTVGGGVATASPFGKRRGYKTRAEAEAAGWVPQTTDIARVIEIYSDSINQAIHGRRLMDVLQNAKLPTGDTLVAPMATAPAGYVFVDHPQMRGKLVHPDVAADLRFVFDTTKVGPIVGALDAINSTQKRLGVSLSLFHAAALEHALIGGMNILRSPVVGVKALGQSFAPRLFGESLAVKMIREGEVGDQVDFAMKSGLEFSLDRQGKAAMVEERPNALYSVMESTSKYLDGIVPGAGKYSVGQIAKINHMFDQAMWGRFHTTLKLQTFWDKMSELSRNNPRMTREQLGQQAASFTNDLYGGLDWYGVSTEFKTRWGRELASAALGPTGRFGMRMFMFAPDWAISSTRAVFKAFGPRGMAAVGGAVLGEQVSPNDATQRGYGAALGALAGYGGARALGVSKSGGSGLRGALPAELGGKAVDMVDLHRQYVLRSALIYTTVVDTLNYQMSGHHLWENKDPTRLDLGDGRTMQVSKHLMESVHLLLDPQKWMMGKGSFLMKESMSQITNKEYWTPHNAPQMGGMDKGEAIPLGARLGHVARQFAPITAQGFTQGNPSNAVASLLGSPIYGKTADELAALKEEKRLKALDKRVANREKALERKLAKQGER